MTLLFAPAPGPRVFALPPGVDFSAALIAGLDARLAGQPPEAVARVEVWVNTQRARRALSAGFAGGPARLMPRIRVVTELAADPLSPVDLPPAVSALERKLDLARLVGALLAAEPGLAAGTAAFDLADSLADLMDEMQGEGVDPAALSGLDVSEHAEHWRRALRFLDLLRGYALAGGMTDGQGRMRAVAQALVAAWAIDPPPHPIIVAGSTGSRGPTRAFMAAVARLPQGALVLPGFDAHLPAAVWARLGADDAGAADHPQHGFRRLADGLDFDPVDVTPWYPVPPPAPERNTLISLALRPAPVTDQWRIEGAALAGTLRLACADITWVEAPDARSEALSIALALRGAAETGIRAALVTPDRVLARRVSGELDRWRLIPDDSAGRPLALTPPGVLLRHLAGLIGTPLTPEALLILLKHPLTDSAPGARQAHPGVVADLEAGQLRGGPPTVSWTALAGWAANRGGATPGWLTWLHDALAPLPAVGPTPLDALADRVRTLAERLAAGPGPAPDRAPDHALWDKEAGRQALALLETLAAEGATFGPVHPAEFAALLHSLLAARDVPEEAVVTSPAIAIWGTLEARVQSADLVILGGLNEGTWPRLPGPDPWLSRTLRRDLGLPAPERQIGLSAHDFQQATGARQVMLTRASRDAEAPTVASRWLLRLENLLLGLGDEGRGALAAARARGDALLAQAVALERPAAQVAAAGRPAPRPPLAARPAALSVTQIETLVRDPYAIYARKVLGLRPLDAPGRRPDAMARGSAIHAVLHMFVTETAAGLPPDARGAFLASLRAVLADVAPWPAVRAIWTARLARATDWFLDGEVARRALATPFAREVGGSLALGGTPTPFAVTARADRIDRTSDGRYAIYDYKSGTVPGPKEAAAFHLQLPLEAAIAQAGGFAGLPPAPVLHLELIGLGARVSLPLSAAPEDIAETCARLQKLIAHYQDPATGFVARLRPQRLTYVSDYDHLSRKGEWADGDPCVPQDAA